MLKQIGQQRLQSMVEKVDLYSLDFENVTKAQILLQGLTHANVKRASKPLGAFFRWATEVCQMYDDVRSNALFYNVDNMNLESKSKGYVENGVDVEKDAAVQIIVTDFN